LWESGEFLNKIYVRAAVILLTLLTGCSPILAQREMMANQKPTQNTTPARPAATAAVTPTIKGTPRSGASLIETRPGSPHGSPQVIHDQVCRQTAAEKKAPGGDEFTTGRFERPFDQNMNYLPALDIQRAELYRPENGWAYVSIILEDAPAPSPAVYGIELDLNIDGRGEYLIQFPAPSTPDWSESGIKMWWDSDGDVGGQVINRSDPKGYKGSGFEALKIDSVAGKNKGKVWTRLIDNGIQAAVHEELLGGKGGKFTWQPFSEGQPFSSSQYDLNDYYPPSKAGSSIVGDMDYPLKELFAIDNTCKGLSGLTPSGAEQGVCPP
jgi:hypothetical protein